MQRKMLVTLTTQHTAERIISSQRKHNQDNLYCFMSKNKVYIDWDPK
jgi:hypothetical protein